MDSSNTEKNGQRFPGKEQSLDLPIKRQREEILCLIEQYSTIVISGFTGCGKSTQVPQYILDYSTKNQKQCNIIVVQPRRIAATSLAKRVCDERSCELGSSCGYQIALEQCASENTQILYCTTGVFLEKLIHEKNMNNYTHIILDEIHERGQDLDMSLILVREFQQTVSQNVKVILMSATIECDKFREYFIQRSISTAYGTDNHIAPELIIEMSGRKHKIQQFYADDLNHLKELPEEALDADVPALHDVAIELCCKLIHSFDDIDGDSRSAVLVFLPGIHEINRVFESLNSANKHQQLKWKVMALYSTLSSKEQHSIFLPVDSEIRKIILATNIAESSITVPDVNYVVDFCLTKTLITDPETNFTTLHLDWCAKDNCTQRAGRTGRVGNGYVYRLVTRDFYDALRESIIPEILRSPIEKVVLKSKKLDMGEPRAVLSLAMDPPVLENIKSAVLFLKEVGGLLMTANGKIKRHDGDLTFLGRIMADLPVGVQVAKLIMLGYIFDILADCIVIGAALTVKSPFTTSYERRFEIYQNKLSWASGSFSDCIILHSVYELWQKEKRRAIFRRPVKPSCGSSQSSFAADEWARLNHLEPKILSEIECLVNELTERLSRLQIKPSKGPDKVVWKPSERAFLMKLAVAGACYPNYFIRSALAGQVNECTAVRSLDGHNPYNTVVLKGFKREQPGSLYLPQVRALFKWFEYLPDVTINNEGTKFYITFQENANIQKLGAIHRDVYISLKMRQYRKFIVKLYSVPQAKQKLAKFLSAYTNSSQTHLKIPQPESVPLLHMTKIIIRFTHVDDPGCFYIHYKENVKKIEELTVHLRTDKNSFQHVTVPVNVGEFYLAPLQTGNVRDYYRAKIVQVEHSVKACRVQVFFVDYGNTIRIPASELRYIPSKYVDLPCQAIRCRLSEVGPSSRLAGAWSSRSTNYFKELCKQLPDYFPAKIYSAIDGVLSLTLYKSGDGDHLSDEYNLNDDLIRNGYAVRIEENYSSKFDHADRSEASQRSWDTKDKKQPLPPLQYQWMQNFPPPSETDDGLLTEIILDGPLSTLEMKMYGICNVMSTKTVGIDPQSVNSILLDSYPDDPHERLMVATDVRHSDISGNRITAFNSTLMPNIHGLSSLICMLFAPQIELRTNEEKTHYTGALCGLGMNKKQRAIFSEHDLEITFDVVFDNDDIDMINRVRGTMNKMLNVPGQMMLGCTNDDKIKYQKEIRHLFFMPDVGGCLPGLFTKHRRSTVAEPTQSKYKWGQNNRGTSSNDTDLKYNMENIFPRHRPLNLESDNSYDDNVFKNLQMLKKLAKRSIHSGGVDCILCSQVLLSGESVYLHILTTSHLEAVSNWRSAARSLGHRVE